MINLLTLYIYSFVPGQIPQNVDCETEICLGGVYWVALWEQDHQGMQEAWEAEHQYSYRAAASLTGSSVAAGPSETSRIKATGTRFSTLYQPVADTDTPCKGL